MSKPRIYTMKWSKIYPLLVQKAEGKGRLKEEVNLVIRWLLGYDAEGIQAEIDNDSTMEAFIEHAPEINPNASLITGVICGHRVEDIEDGITQKIRYLDKLVDELAKGKSMEKILRKG